SRQVQPDTLWSPLALAAFRAIWIASVVSNVGSWMQNVGVAWQMTTLTPSPVLVALIQTATSLPVFLVGLPAGTLADLVDRRRLQPGARDRPGARRTACRGSWPGVCVSAECAVVPGHDRGALSLAPPGGDQRRQLADRAAERSTARRPALRSIRASPSGAARPGGHLRRVRQCAVGAAAARGAPAARARLERVRPAACMPGYRRGARRVCVAALPTQAVA